MAVLKDIWDNLKTDLWFYALSGISIALLIASFLVPPMGIIDASVLKAVAEIFAWGVLGTVIKAINKGVDARLKHGDTSVTIGDLNKDNEEEED